MTNRRRPKGNGTISFVKSSNKYRAQFTTPEGNRPSKYFDTLQDAELWLSQQRTDVLSNKYIEPSKMTLGEWFTEYISTYCAKLRPKTKLGYIQVSKHLAPLKNIPIQKLSAPIVQRFFNNADMSDSGKYRAYSFLKQALNKAVAIELIGRNILKNKEAVKVTKSNQTEIETFTAEEIKQLLATIKSSKDYNKYYPLFQFAICSGCRAGEVLGLKIHNVLKDRVKIDNSLQTAHNKAYDSAPKTAAGFRDITLPLEVIAELHKAYNFEQPAINSGYVFHTKNGTPLSITNVERSWRAILKLAGLKPRHIHALRHTHATELLAKGIPIIEVSRRLGHAKVSYTLDLYGHKKEGLEDKIPHEISSLFLS